MKRLLIGLSVLVALAIVPLDASAQQRLGPRGGGPGGVGRGAATQTQTRNFGQGQSKQLQLRQGNQGQPISGVVANDPGSINLARLWEEEKLARDVYTKLAATSKIQAFRNIARAESQHMQAVSRLFAGSGGKANRPDDTPGVFSIPEYAQLYQTLVASGSRSPVDALMVGAKIEEMDIADLRQIIAQVGDPRTRQTMERLMNGSQQHLRAFASQLAMQGASYTAQYLTQAEFDAIANAPGNGQGMRGGGPGYGQGQGQGQGQGLGQGQGQGLGPGQGFGQGQGLGSGLGRGQGQGQGQRGRGRR